MPESRLQSDMIQNMSRAQRAAMFQRGQIASNQRQWLDYAQVRDGGAFQPSYGGGYLHEEVHPSQRGRTNPYLKYYAAQQARQAEFQRQRFLNAQRFQNNYMLQQQKAQDIQFAADQEVTRTKQEMERKLSVVSSELDALQNNPEIDQNSWEYKARRQQLLDDRYELETDLERNTPQVHEEDSGFKDSQGNPIMSRFILDKNDEPIYHAQGKEIAANQLERDKFEQAKIDAARKANYDEKVLEQTIFKNETDRLDKRNKKNENDLKAAGLDVDPEAEMMKGFGQKAHDELMAPRKADAREALKGLYDRDHGKGEWSLLDKEDKDAKVEEFINDPSFVGPSKEELRNKAKQLYDRTQPIPEDEYGDEAMYESPMDPGMEPEFSDEQFAGTEPAGLYDPTGQPLPMDGGMYNGLA